MKNIFYINYPQEHVEGQAHTYCCAHCKVLTTTINGRLEGHLPSCEYRMKLAREGFEIEAKQNNIHTSTADDFD